MPNPIKYTTGTESDALVKGNFRIGTGSVGKGPSDTTGYYQAVSPPNGGYVIYLNNPNATSNMSYHIANNDSELISFTNGLAGQSYTTANECLLYYAGQTDKVCLNRDYEGIVTDGLVLNLDAGFTPSYPKNGTTWYDVGGNNNGTLINGPTFNSANGGSIVFDGVDDRANFGTSEILRPTYLTLNVWLKSENTGPGGSTRLIVGYYGNGEGYNMTQYPYTYSNQVNCYIGNGGFRSGNAIQVELVPNTWTNICMTYDGTNQTVYKNGVFFEAKTRILTYYLVNTFLSMGVHSFTTSASYFKGSNSITQLYNRVLTSQEITQNYNAQKGRFGL